MYKKIGFFSVVSYVIGSSVGAGIFLIPSSLAAFGSISLLGWCVTAMGTLLITFSLMRLSRAKPHAGGPYAYAHEVLGTFWGYQSAWNYWVSNWLSNAALGVGFASYFSVFFPAVGTDPFWGFCVASGAVWLMTFVNLLGVYESGIVQIISTLLKLLPIAIILVLGAPHVEMVNFSPIVAEGTAPLASVMAASTITMWAFLGFECGTVPAGDIENPKKVIPRALITGTWIVVIICIFTSALAMGIIPQQELMSSAAPFSKIARFLFGPYGEAIMSVVVLISTLGTINALVMIQGQVPAAAAAKGVFPKWAGRKNKKHVPVVATLFSSVLITLILAMNYTKSLVEQFNKLLLLSTVAALIAYVLSVIADLKLSGLKKPKVLLQCAFGIAYLLWAFVGAGGEALMLTAIFLAAISLFYPLIVRR